MPATKMKPATESPPKEFMDHWDSASEEDRANFDVMAEALLDAEDDDATTADDVTDAMCVSGDSELFQWFASLDEGKRAAVIQTFKD